MLRQVIYILSITCVGYFNLNAALFGEGNRPGDDKKNKAKREDTTKFVLNQEPSAEQEETPDTTQILFPSHDLYSSWDESKCHPYKFNEAFKEDSVVITLTQE